MKKTKRVIKIKGDDWKVKDFTQAQTLHIFVGTGKISGLYIGTVENPKSKNAEEDILILRGKLAKRTPEELLELGFKPVKVRKKRAKKRGLWDRIKKVVKRDG